MRFLPACAALLPAFVMLPWRRLGPKECLPGTAPTDAATGAFKGATSQEQTRQCLTNVQTILDEAGCSVPWARLPTPIFRRLLSPATAAAGTRGLSCRQAQKRSTRIHLDDKLRPY